MSAFNVLFLVAIVDVLHPSSCHWCAGYVHGAGGSNHCPLCQPLYALWLDLSLTVPGQAKLKWRLASQACCMWGYSWLLFYYVTGQWVMTALNCSCVSFSFCWNWQNACGLFSAISMYSICNCPWSDGTCLLLNYTGWCVFLAGISKAHVPLLERVCTKVLTGCQAT